MLKVYEIRNDFKIARVAKAITANSGAGSASQKKIETVLREFKEVTGVKNLHYLTGEIAGKFYQYLKECGQSNSSISNKISYFNEVLRYAGRNDIQQTAKELEVSRRNDIYSYKGNSRQDMETVQRYFKEVDKLEFQGLYHAQRLQETCGLRMAESGGIKLLKKDIGDIKNGLLKINGLDLSKNDRDRVVYLNEAGIKAVLDARGWLKENKLKDIAASRTDFKITSWTTWAWGQINALKKIGIIDSKYHNHGNRHFWANEKYETAWEKRTGIRIEATAKSQLFDKEWLKYVETKINLEESEIKKIDEEIRKEVSQQLGHERIAISETYLGKTA